MYDTEHGPDVGQMAAKLPIPKGYKVLVALAKMKDRKGNVLLPDQYQTLENTASIMGLVISMGPDAFADTDKFPAGPYCKPDDWVMFRSYSGTRFRVEDAEFRIINDDQVEAVVPQPELVERI